MGLEHGQHPVDLLGLLGVLVPGDRAIGGHQRAECRRGRLFLGDRVSLVGVDDLMDYPDKPVATVVDILARLGRHIGRRAVDDARQCLHRRRVLGFEPLHMERRRRRCPDQGQYFLVEIGLGTKKELCFVEVFDLFSHNVIVFNVNATNLIFLLIKTRDFVRLFLNKEVYHVFPPVHDAGKLVFLAFLPVHDAGKLVFLAFLPVHDAGKLVFLAFPPVHDAGKLVFLAFPPVHDAGKLVFLAFPPVHDAVKLVFLVFPPMHDVDKLFFLVFYEPREVTYIIRNKKAVKHADQTDSTDERGYF